MKQLTSEQAITFAENGKWQDMTDKEIVEFQLFQKCLCMPFSKFHESMEKVLGRPIWTHEFAFPDLLKAEYNKTKTTPTMEEIINLIPEEKRVVVTVK